MKRIQVLAATLLVVLAALAVEAQLPTKQVLTLEAAKKIAQRLKLKPRNAARQS